MQFSTPSLSRWSDNAPIFSARSVSARRCTRVRFLRAAIRVRKRTLVHLRAETLRAEKMDSCSKIALKRCKAIESR